MLPEISAAASASKSFHEIAGNRLWGFFIKPQVTQTVYGGGGLRAACRKAESDYRSALGDEQATRLDVRYAAVSARGISPRATCCRWRRV